ncbi:MAG TPA: universal stress protein [Streptosporangiaceae bacterium]|jgi:nucleotide-binding universal stress UspA family protein
MSDPIVVGTDGSRHGDTAVRWAADEAARRQRPLHIAHVLERWLYDIPRFPVKGARDPLIYAGQDLLTAAEKLAREQQPDIAVETELIESEIVRALHERAGEAFEIVVGHRGHGGFTSLLLGSTGLRLAGHTPGPVVIVRGDATTRHGVVVVGVDLDDDSSVALEYAFEAAATRDARLHMLHASRHAATLATTAYIPDLEELERKHEWKMGDTVASWRARYPGVEVTTELVRGHPVAALAEASRAADLIVIGARGSGSMHEIRLGSISHGVIHHAHCPVAVVRPHR